MCINKYTETHTHIYTHIRVCVYIYIVYEYMFMPLGYLFFFFFFNLFFKQNEFCFVIVKYRNNSAISSKQKQKKKQFSPATLRMAFCKIFCDILCKNMDSFIQQQPTIITVKYCKKKTNYFIYIVTLYVRTYIHMYTTDLWLNFHRPSHCSDFTGTCKLFETYLLIKQFSLIDFLFSNSRSSVYC